MPGVTEDQVARARDIDLLSYLQAYEPHELKRDGPSRYTTVTHGSLVISNGKWRWNSRGTAARRPGLSDEGARRWTSWRRWKPFPGERAASIPAYQSPPPKRRPFYPAESRFATPPTPCPICKNAAFIPDIIGKCIRAGTIYESPV